MMTILKGKIQLYFGKHLLWYVFLLWTGWSFTCFGETISYTSQPTAITVAFTGVLTTGKWLYIKNQAKKNKTLLTYTLAKDVPFNEYVKDVSSHEWNRALGRDETDEFLNIGAIAVKTRAWGIRNNRKYQGIIKGDPDVQSSKVDQIYIQSQCKTEIDKDKVDVDKNGVADDPICMGKKWKRVKDGVVDQAVNNTWNTILKRHNCYYQYGVGRYKDRCSGVFETSYNRTEIGCKGGSDGKGVDLLTSHSCVPQNEARMLIEEDGKMYTEVLAKYYKPLSLYERTADDLKVNSTIEALSTCMLILFDLDGLSQYKCLKSNKDDTKIDKVHFRSRTERGRLVCQEGNTNCPMGELYVTVGTKGILLEKQINKDHELWLKVQWKVKSGSNVGDDQSKSEHVIVGWSPDTDIKPANAMSLVEVKIVGARVKANV